MLLFEIQTANLLSFLFDFGALSAHEVEMIVYSATIHNPLYLQSSLPHTKRVHLSRYIFLSVPTFSRRKRSPFLQCCAFRKPIYLLYVCTMLFWVRLGSSRVWNKIHPICRKMDSGGILCWIFLRFSDRKIVDRSVCETVTKSAGHVSRSGRSIHS